MNIISHILNMRDLLIKYAIKYQGNYRKIIKAINEKQTIDEDIHLQQAITILDDNYPKQLKELTNPPLVLFYQGNISLLNEQKIAIIGSRDASDYGIKTTIDIINKIKDDYCIVSGLAKGIDAIAHIYAKSTIAVIGNGLDITYPKENIQLYQKIKENNLIISEYPLHTKPRKEHFPARNRIIAALCDKIIVTQANKRSGTMITVNYGLNLNKEILAVSYPYFNSEGIGCNNLINEGATLICHDNIKYLFDKGNKLV